MEDSSQDASASNAARRKHSTSSISPTRMESFTSRTQSKSTSASIFSRLPFLRSHTSDTAISASDEVPSPGKSREPELPIQRNPTMASVMEQQGRKRRSSSLRKAAMLGTGLLRRGRSNSDVEGSKANPKLDQASTSTPLFSSVLASRLSPRRFTFELPTETSPTEAFPDINQELTIDTASTTSEAPIPVAYSPVTSPVDAQESTFINPTSIHASHDNDEDLPGLRNPIELPAKLAPKAPRSLSPSPPSSTSSSHLAVPFSSSPIRQRSIKSANKSPLAFTPPSHETLSSLVPSASNASISIASSEDWDYSQTEWWGWVVLIVTWVVFVVGMGSCLGVWSWAWDVEQKPYAPPELSDDPTLPIVGYYPALIVMTAVMSWVWVVVAWVGMKYFKHAKIQGD